MIMLMNVMMVLRMIMVMTSFDDSKMIHSRCEDDDGDDDILMMK